MRTRLHCLTLISMSAISALAAASMKIPRLPSIPKSALSAYGLALTAQVSPSFDNMLTSALLSEEQRDSIFKLTKNVAVTTTNIMRKLKIGDFNVDDLINSNIAQLDKEELRSEAIREGRVSQVIEKFTEARMFLSFFKTGALAPLSQLGICNDEEYVGAALGFAQELARYGVGCAIEGDTESIAICRRILIELNSKMLEFDFRNGNLRRKYDGLKYTLKKLEDITYEMSLVAPTEEHLTKKVKLASIEEDALLYPVIPMMEIDEIRSRMDVYDKLREEVIKSSRDVQKLSKQGIFSVHRGALTDSKNKLDLAFKSVEAILSRIGSHAGLRQGAVSNSIEEWAEGALLLEWMVSKKLLTKEELRIANDFEYVGGLSDFTGEIGRVAVAYATNRDIDGVKLILETGTVVLSALNDLNVTGKYSKKVEAVVVNMRKIEDVAYELTLLSKGGRASREKGADDEFVSKGEVNDE